MSDALEVLDRPSWSKRLLRIAVLLVALGAGGAAVYWYLIRDDAAPVPAATQQQATATKGRLVSSLSTSGTARAMTTSNVTFGTAGKVASISVAVGSVVTQGQELARLDDKDAKRKLDQAQSNLTTAQLRLQSLKDPPKDADVASARQSVTSANQSLVNAQSQLATAQANLAKAKAGPAAADVSAADTAVTQAQSSLENAQRGVDSAWTSLLNSQRNYCLNSSFFTVNVCYTGDVPLSDSKIADLNRSLVFPPGTAAQQTTITSAIRDLLSSNSSYLNSKVSVTNAESALASAKTKRAALDAPPDPTTIAQLEASVTSATAGIETAKAGIVSAQAKLDALLAGTAATDIALQEQSVKVAQIAYDEAKDAMDALVLRAPFAGAVTTVSVNAGDQVGASTAILTVTNPDGIRIDLTVSESDISSLKAGQFAIATFDALPGRTYLLKLVSVVTQGTVSQGVVTFPVQAQILRQADLAANQTELTKIAAALGSLATGGGSVRSAGTGGNGGGGGFVGGTNGGGDGGFVGGTNGGGGNGFAGNGGGGNGAAGGGNFAARTPPANFTPPAGRTPGAGGGAAGGAGGQGVALAALLNAALPSPGMSASVTVLLNVVEDTILVPTSAIRRQGRTTFVLVLKPDGTTEQRTVVTGGTDATNTSITSGLEENEVIVIGGSTTAARTPGAGAGGAATSTPRVTPAGGVR